LTYPQKGVHMRGGRTRNKINTQRKTPSQSHIRPGTVPKWEEMDSHLTNFTRYMGKNALLYRKIGRETVDDRKR